MAKLKSLLLKKEDRAFEAEEVLRSFLTARLIESLVKHSDKSVIGLNTEGGLKGLGVGLSSIHGREVRDLLIDDSVLKTNANGKHRIKPMGVLTELDAETLGEVKVYLKELTEQIRLLEAEKRLQEGQSKRVNSGHAPKGFNGKSMADLSGFGQGG